MSSADSQAALDRIAARLADRDATEGRAYLFLAFAILAYQSPEVVEFILDRADERTKPNGVPA